MSSTPRKNPASRPSSHSHSHSYLPPVSSLSSSSSEGLFELRQSPAPPQSAQQWVAAERKRVEQTKRALQAPPRPITPPPPPSEEGDTMELDSLKQAVRRAELQARLDEAEMRSKRAKGEEFRREKSWKVRELRETAICMKDIGMGEKAQEVLEDVVKMLEEDPEEEEEPEKEEELEQEEE